MNKSRSERLDELVAAARELPPAQWPSFLAERTEDAPEVLVAALARLRQPTPAELPPQSSVDASAAPSSIGPYRIVRERGRGGMGIVYEGLQTEPVRRKVAIKVIDPEQLDDMLVRRFEEERRALARLQHPGIAHVYECGTDGQGWLYMVMELVDGEPIDAYCDRTRLSLDERVWLLGKVCAAIQHAHQQGVIHRDLKPSNVLVIETDGEPAVKVIDFGLARLIRRRRPVDWLASAGTTEGGTPTHMAPEQAIGTAEVDTRADVYALGVLTYELLVGRVPLPPDLLFRGDVGGFGHALRTLEPPLMSDVLAADPAAAIAVAKARQVPLRRLRQALVLDLDWVARKALAKARDDRYQTVAELQAELHRFLRCEPLLEGPRTARYRIGKFVQRNRGRVAAVVALVLLASISGVVIVTNAVARARLVSEFQQLEGVVALRRLRAEDSRVVHEIPANVPVLEQWLDQTDELLRRRPRFAAARDELAAAAPTVSQPFTDDAQGFLFAELGGLLDGLQQLQQQDRPAVERSLTFARRVRAATHEHPGARHGWDAVRRAIAAGSRYPRSLELRDDDVLGLVPVGENPSTGLWEFYHLRSAWDGRQDPAEIPIPSHDGQGNIAVNGRTGIVFVLLPGGMFHDIRLAPFFLARHELTRGQWERLGGSPKVFWHPDGKVDVATFDAAHPAESMDWNHANGLLQRHALLLPTEEQWEYGCRADTKSLWSTGADRDSLHGFANLRDRAAAEARPEWGPGERFLDGSVYVAKVGSLRPNGFGLHDMHGNVQEWCLDWLTPQGTEPRRGDGLRQPEKGARDEYKMVRGGSYFSTADAARSGARQHVPITHRESTLGLRAARALKPTFKVGGS